MGKAYSKEVKKFLTTKALELRKRNLTFKQIGKELDISPGTAFHLIGEKQRDIRESTIDQIRELRREGKKSYAQISEIIGLGATTVRDILLQDDLEKEKKLQADIFSRSGKIGANARWGGSEEEKKATLLRERKTRNKKRERRKKILPPMPEKRQIPSAIGYIRVSTEEQAKKGMSLAMQERIIQNFAKAKEWELIDVIKDPGQSGKNMVRPGLKKVIDLCKKNKVDVVIIYKLDRLSRRIRDIIFLVEDIFEKNKIDLASVTETIDTSTAMGRAFFWISSVFGQLEREKTGERVADARADREKRGFWTGRLPYGYKLAMKRGKHIKGKITPIYNMLKHYDKAKEYYDKGHSLEEVSKMFNVGAGGARRLVQTDKQELMKKMRPFILNGNDKASG